MGDETGIDTRLPGPLRALILEDDPLDAELTVATLRQAGYALTFDLVDSHPLLHERLRAANYDIVLADYNLGAWTAMDALESLRESGKDIPLIVVTGTLGDEEAVKCISRGASDYVLKQHLERLPLAVEGALQRKANRVELARQQEEIRQAKEEWELTFNTVPDPILIMDEQFRIKRANKAVATVLGLEVEQFLGKCCYEVMHGLPVPHPDCPYQSLMVTGKEKRSDITDLRPGRTFEATASPFYDASGSIRGCVHILRDITDRKRAEESLRQLSARLLHVQDNERRRIARELHDSIGQSLAALDLNLGWIKQSFNGIDSPTQGVLADSLKLVAGCSREIRDFSYLLHPPTLDEYGLASAVRWYVEGFARRTGIRVSLDIPEGMPRLPLDIETALFRVVQECLTNVHRHARSRTAKIRITQESNRLCVEVADRGRGEGSAAHRGNATRPGVGIAGMRERLRELGGTFEFESGSRGTTVRASLTLEGKAA